MLEYKVNKRNEFVPLIETHRVNLNFPFTIFLKETPDIASDITINNMTRIYTMPTQDNEFFVSRTGDVYFNEGKKGTTIVINYFGGGSRLNADDWNVMIDTLNATNTRITDVTNLIFGNISLKVTPNILTTSPTTLNTSNSNGRQVTFNLSLINNTNQVYTWLTNIPYYVIITKSFADSDIAAPRVATPLNIIDRNFINGVASFTVIYDTDYGTYKKYMSGDYVSYGISTVNPDQQGVGLNLSVTVVESIQ